MYCVLKPNIEIKYTSEHKCSMNYILYECLLYTVWGPPGGRQGSARQHPGECALLQYICNNFRLLYLLLNLNDPVSHRRTPDACSTCWTAPGVGISSSPGCCGPWTPWPPLPPPLRCLRPAWAWRAVLATKARGTEWAWRRSLLSRSSSSCCLTRSV